MHPVPKPLGPKVPATRRERVSVSLDSDDYAHLKRIAAERRVSLAWVVRDAVGEYIYRRSPLFRAPPPSGSGDDRPVALPARPPKASSEPEP